MQTIEQLTSDLKTLSLSRIADIIAQDWPVAGQMYFGAKPYHSAMYSLETMSDMYGADTARSIVAYFLGNATRWKGEVARAVKKELNARLKNY